MMRRSCVNFPNAAHTLVMNRGPTLYARSTLERWRKFSLPMRSDVLALAERHLHIDLSGNEMCLCRTACDDDGTVAL